MDCRRTPTKDVSYPINRNSLRIRGGWNLKVEERKVLGRLGLRFFRPCVSIPGVRAICHRARFSHTRLVPLEETSSRLPHFIRTRVSQLPQVVFQSFPHW